MSQEDAALRVNGAAVDPYVTGDGGVASYSPVRARLEAQIAGCDAKRQETLRRFKELKVCRIVVTAAIPVAAAPAPVWLTWSGGALIVILEGLQPLQRYQQNWTGYRHTCERLTHDKFLGRARPYAGVPNFATLLAERVQGLKSQERAAWVSPREDRQRIGGEE
jgi:Protein of unknown function (DUF4231)